MHPAGRLIAWIALFSLFFAVPLQGQVPLLINYQGRLVDGGKLVNADVAMRLRLYPTSTGGAPIYEDASTVTVVDGLYSTFLGDDTVLGSLSFALASNEVWVEVEVDGTVLAPRERLAAVAYAIMAAGVPDGTISGAMLDDDAVTSPKIQDGGIELRDIGQDGADPGQVMKWDGAAWAPADDMGTGTTDHGDLSGLSDDDHTQYYLVDGSRTLAGNLDAGSNRISNLGAGAASSDAVRHDQVVKIGDPAGGDLEGTYPNPTIDDGPGSGLNADLLDGISSGHFLRSNVADVFNSAGAAINFRFEGGTDPYLLFIDGIDDRVGIGTSDPTHRLHVVGGSYFQGSLYIGTAEQSRISLGSGRLVMKESDGTATVDIRSEDSIGDGAIMFLSNDEGDETIEFDADEGGDSAIRLSMAGGQETLVLDADYYGLGAVAELKDPSGIVRISAKASEEADEGARLALVQAGATETIVLDGDHYSESGHYGARVDLNQDSGNTTIRLRADAGGGSAIYCNDSSENLRLRVGVYDASGGHIEMRDENNSLNIRLYAGGAFGGNSGGAIHLDSDGGSTLELAADYDGTGFSRVVTDVVEIRGGADLAERFDVTPGGQGIEPGMVVVIDADHPGRLVLSGSAYDRKAAGVVSGAGGVRPGMLMGQGGSVADGEHPVALTGRVWTWCDAAGGAIGPGDMLTTSGTPGHAMKAADHRRARGAVIGKAMSSLREGTGLVLTLVALQ